MTVPLVLASESPRRQQLLAVLGLAFEVAHPGVDETWRPGEAPATYVERVAREKVRAVQRAGTAVVAADTAVVIDGRILGKPKDANDAARMLRSLAGRDHTVFTGVAVAFDGRVASAVESTGVRFRALDEETITAYVATGEPLDKAGSYATQGYGAVLIERIDGDYFTVMGLGLGKLVELLRSVGLRYRFGPLIRDPASVATEVPAHSDPAPLGRVPGPDRP